MSDWCLTYVDDLGPYIKTDGVLLLKGYNFTFRPEAADFVLEVDFVPFIWQRKDKDGADDKDWMRRVLGDIPSKVNPLTARWRLPT